MTEFSDETGLRIRPVYYPPHHSKYNPVERCRRILGGHWNGTVSKKQSARAGTMTRRGIRPVVKLTDKVYEKGVVYNERLNRSTELPKYDVRIEPIFRYIIVINS